MNVSCPECRSIFRVDPAKVPAAGVRARCSVCGGIVVVGAGASIDDEFGAVQAAPAIERSEPEAVTSRASQPPFVPEPVHAREPAVIEEPSPAPVGAESPPVAPTPPATVTAAPSEAIPATSTPSSPIPVFETPATATAVVETPAEPGSAGSAEPVAAEGLTADVAPPTPTPVVAPPAVPPTPPPPLVYGRALTPPASAPPMPRRAPAGPASAPPPRPPFSPRSGTGPMAALRPSNAPQLPPLVPPSVPKPAMAPPSAVPRPPLAAPVPAPSVAPAPSPSMSKRTPINPFLANDPNAKARRLSRALVSDLVTYFPQRREEGLRDGTLSELFREEIKKSREEYVDQVGREFAESTTHFEDALNEILAAGRKMF